MKSLEDGAEWWNPKFSVGAQTNSPFAPWLLPSLPRLHFPQVWVTAILPAYPLQREGKIQGRESARACVLLSLPAGLAKIRTEMPEPLA